MTSQSTAPKLRDLLRELQPTVAKWENIGVMLNISDGELGRIKADNNNDSSNSMRDMLRAYLKQTNPPPSWEEVAEALEFLGLSDVARHIRSTHL